MADNLKWGFALYSSPGSFDPECEDPVSMGDLKHLVFTMTRYVRRRSSLSLHFLQNVSDPRSSHLSERFVEPNSGIPPGTTVSSAPYATFRAIYAHQQHIYDTTSVGRT